MHHLHQKKTGVQIEKSDATASPEKKCFAIQLGNVDFFL